MATQPITHCVTSSAPGRQVASTGLIFDIRKYSIHDGPGIRTTVFLKGCPLNCWWCHNPEGKSAKPEMILRQNRCIRCGACLPICSAGATGLSDEGLWLDREKCDLCGSCLDICFAEAREMAGTWMSVDQVLQAVEADRPFYDQSGGGVTFSGGEPLMQADFLEALLDACRQKMIHTALDTSGFAPWKRMERMLSRVDLFLYDVKLIDEARHKKFTGISNRLILANLLRLVQSEAQVIVRIPLIPGINDDEANLRATGALLAGLPGEVGVDVLPYHPSAQAKYAGLGLTYPLDGTPVPDSERLEEIVSILEGYSLKVKIGG